MEQRPDNGSAHSPDPVEEVPVDDGEIVDELPEDLNLSEFVGPYTFPNNNRRRIPAATYILIGLGCILAFATSSVRCFCSTRFRWSQVGNRSPDGSWTPNRWSCSCPVRRHVC